MSEQRAAVIAEAQSWINTPFHHGARLKGVGVDCLMLLAEIYERVGIVEHVTPGHYPPDWHLHKDEERYLAGLRSYAPEIEGPPLPGDIALFHFGRTFSHGAIVVEWPRLIHAYWAARAVVWGDATKKPLQGRKTRFFSPFAAARTAPKDADVQGGNGDTVKATAAAPGQNVAPA